MPPEPRKVRPSSDAAAAPIKPRQIAPAEDHVSTSAGAPISPRQTFTHFVELQPVEVSPPAPRFQNPNQARINELERRILGSNPELGPVRPRVQARLSQLLQRRTDELMNWGATALAELQMATTSQRKYTAQFVELNAGEWINSAKEAAQKPPNVFSRLLGKSSPDYYKVRLTGFRGELSELLPKIERARDELRPKIETMSVDVAILQALIQDEQDAIRLNIINNRARTLLGAQQTSILALKALENLALTIIDQVSVIDRLLSVTIPNWELAIKQS